MHLSIQYAIIGVTFDRTTIHLNVYLLCYETHHVSITSKISHVYATSFHHIIPSYVHKTHCIYQPNQSFYEAIIIIIIQTYSYYYSVLFCMVILNLESWKPMLKIIIISIFLIIIIIIIIIIISMHQ